MTTTQKLELVNLLSPTGSIYENEKRTMFGLMPLPELEGKRYMSLNWVDADMANQYQMGKVGNVQMDVVYESKDETITEDPADTIFINKEPAPAEEKKNPEEYIDNASLDALLNAASGEIK